ncbi:MAG: flagellar biosynthesis anti-sigma factor FlgM [Planctomycetales bacterium]|nr:flagellar biosynthesis anti-sigma factor FlgM [Planctomycetales bacterium]
MQIHGASHVHGPHNLSGPHAPRSAQGAPATRTQSVDQLDISPEAAAASQSGDVRADLVARIKGQIAAGTYETSDKLNGALDRLLDEIG